LGNIEETGDERSIVYATGGKDKLRALIFINFDPAIKLSGLKDWQGQEQPCLPEDAPFIKIGSIHAADIGPEE
jgi:hypothetical protein